jgi:hypothetical protein
MSTPPAPATIDTVLEAIHSLAGDVRSMDGKLEELRGAHEDLKRRVDGSDPPANGGEPIAKQARRGSQASFDVEEVRGELIAVRAELANQSRAMGLGLGSFTRWLMSKDGRTTIVRLATLAGVAYAAFHTAGVIK